MNVFIGSVATEAHASDQAAGIRRKPNDINKCAVFTTAKG